MILYSYLIESIKKNALSIITVCFLCICGILGSSTHVYAAQTQNLSIWSTQSIPPAVDAFTNDNDDPLQQPKWAFDIGKIGGIFTYADIDMPLYTTIDVTLDAISIVLMLICLFILIKTAREYGKSNLGIVMLYLLNATVVLGTIRLTFILQDDNFYIIHDITEMAYWHVLFYYSVILFIVAGNILSNLVTVSANKASYAKAIFYLILSIVMSISFVIAMPYTDNFIVKYVQPATFSIYGGYHILSILLAIPTAIYLHRIKTKSKGLDKIIGNIYIALIIVATISGWELINETLKWVQDSDQFGEMIERVLWIPVFIFILRTYLNIRVKSVQQQTAAGQNSVTEDFSKPQTIISMVKNSFKHKEQLTSTESILNK